MIYLLRHGETVWNTVGRITGPEAQFKSYVSPLGRAQETAARITKIIPLTFEEVPRLIEVSVGLWDGMTLYEIGAEYPDALIGFDAFDWFFRSPNGESFDQACERVSSWLSEVSAPAIAISHHLRADCYAVSILVCPSAKCLNSRCHKPASIGSTTADRN